MDRTRRGPWRAALRIFFGALLAFSFFLFVLWRTDNPRLTRIRVAMVDFAAPVLETIAGPSSGLAEIFDGVQTLSELRAENERLKTELLRLRRWENDAQRLEQENAQLRALNSVSLPPRTRVVTGEVVADSGGIYAQSVIVNVGRCDVGDLSGCDRAREVEQNECAAPQVVRRRSPLDGAPVRDARGLVGRVVGVGDRSVRVLLLTDPTSRVPVHVTIEGERRRAVLIGDETLTPILSYVDGEGAVPSGARVITSGEGGVFPKGLVVGEVVSRGDQVARVALAADYRYLDFVQLYLIDQPSHDPSGLILRAVSDLSGSAPGAAAENEAAGGARSGGPQDGGAQGGGAQSGGAQGGGERAAAAAPAAASPSSAGGQTPASPAPASPGPASPGPNSAAPPAPPTPTPRPAPGQRP